MTTTDPPRHSAPRPLTGTPDPGLVPTASPRGADPFTTFTSGGIDRLDRRRCRRLSERRPPSAPPLLDSSDHRNGALRCRALRGELLTVAPGWFVDAEGLSTTAWVRTQQLALARATAVARRMAFGHAIGGAHAALLHGVPVLHIDDTVAVYGTSFPSTRSTRVGHRRVTRCDVVPHIASARGIPVLDLPYLALETARGLSPDAALVTVDGILATTAQPVPWRRSDGDAAVACAIGAVTRIAQEQGRRRGDRQARRILEVADGWAESPLESRVRRLALTMGLPRPRLQHAVLVGGAVVVLDMYWEFETSRGPVRLAIEADGATKLTDSSAILDLLARDQAIRAAGIPLVRASWADVGPTRRMRLIEAVLAALPTEVLWELRPDASLLSPTERRTLLPGIEAAIDTARSRSRSRSRTP